MRHTSTTIIALSGLVWFLCVFAGFGILTKYEYASGSAARPSTRWPSNSKVSLSLQNLTLVMLAHPECPCTRASIYELSQLMSRRKGIKAYVLFVVPSSDHLNWRESELHRAARNIPGVSVINDFDGAEAALFDAETSGQTLLYNTVGLLVFSGGLTGSRGQIGENSGLSAILSAIHGIRSAARTSVFGCRLARCIAQ